MPVRTIRVVVVDDAPTIRKLLRLTLAADDRFDVVGEAGDGVEAVARAEEHQPDVMVLDRDMPRLDGVAAIPQIRDVAPRCAIVLFTAAPDAGTYQAAMAAGARDVIDKSVVGTELLDALGSAVLAEVAERSAVAEVRVGPVPSAAARAWISNTRRIMHSLRANPGVLGPAMDAATLDMFERFLDSWWSVADADEEFLWRARSVPEEVRSLVERWAVVDRMTDDQLAALGVHWAPPEGAPFFEALTAGVVAALAEHEATRDLAGSLAGQWAAPVARPEATSDP